VPIVGLAEIAAAIRRCDPIDGIHLVGIDGPAGSGKSTLARRLAPLLRAPIATTDDFLSWTDLERWWPRFEAEVLTPLQAGRDATYQVRDWQDDPEGDSIARWKTTPWAPFVVLEGVTSTRRAVADQLVYRIWVEAPDELRLQRGLGRDGEYWLHHWADWREMEAQFFAADRTRERADLLVDGDPRVRHDADVEVVSP
jgi:uridine kinase